MTLNGKIALILRCCAEFGSLRGTLRKSGWQSHNYGQFTTTVSSKQTSAAGLRDAHGINIV